MLIAEANKLKEYYRKQNLSYGAVFDQANPAVQDILADLARFCRADRTTFHSDPRVHALLEGRREVYLRIMDFLTLNHEQLFEKYSRPLPDPSTQGARK